MKAILILLLFPIVGYSYIKGIPYKKNEICEKTMKDISNANNELTKAVNKRGGRHFMELSVASAKSVSAFRNAEKYKCFKQTIACKESVQDMRRSYSNLSKANKAIHDSDRLFNLYLKSGNRVKAQKASDSIDELSVNSSSSFDDIIEALKNMHNFCK